MIRGYRDVVPVAYIRVLKILARFGNSVWFTASWVVRHFHIMKFETV